MTRLLIALQSMPETVLAINAIIGLLAITTLALISIFIVHTMYTLGLRTIMYKHRPPAADWNKRFYPAISMLMLFLLALMWALNAWRHSFHS